MAGKCFRCGRYGHYADSCFAQTTFSGKRLRDDYEEEPYQCFKCGNYGHFASDCFAKKRSGVYVIKHSNGMIYVGKSNDIDQRIAQHEHSKGFLVELPTITEPLHNDHESWERNETLAQMNKHGIEKVRGWMYTTKILTKSNVKSIQEQLCEKFDLCRVCASGSDVLKGLWGSEERGEGRTVWKEA